MHASNVIPSYTLVIPTYNAGSNWVNCLTAIRQQSVQPVSLVIIDSSSRDSTVELAHDFACNVLTIVKEEFGHGKTRQFSLNYIEKSEIVVFMTQDAILLGVDSIKHLLAEFKDKKVNAAYGRQIGRPVAGLLESFERSSNYPSVSSVKSLGDTARYGLKTAFISNSFAAYSLSRLNGVGGFPLHTILAEDMYVAGKMLLTGGKIAYCAEASVYHSHDYSINQTFKRYFDTGVFHAREPWIRETFGGASSEGLKYIVAEFNYLFRQSPAQIPYTVLKNVAKYVGFKLGNVERYIPIFLKKKMSMHSSYWVNSNNKH